MFECDTLWACRRRLPVISLLAMTGADPSSGIFSEQDVRRAPASHEPARVPGQVRGEQLVAADRGHGRGTSRGDGRRRVLLPEREALGRAELPEENVQ